MSRTTTSFIVRCTVVAIALGASGAALAGDNSMSPLTGESYAYFHGLENVPGGFNVAAATPLRAPGEVPARLATAQSKSKSGPPVMLVHQAVHEPTITPPRIFDNGTGA